MLCMPDLISLELFGLGGSNYRNLCFHLKEGVNRKEGNRTVIIILIRK